MIEVKVKKTLGNFLLDSELKDENFICLIGKNGSGKTSLLNLIAGICEPDEGYVKINSEIVTNVKPEKKGIVLITPDSYIPNFNVERHLLWGARLQKKQVQEEVVSEIREKLGINYHGKVSKLSLGMRERVSLATALIASPKAILVDEAFGNIDNRKEFLQAYREYASKSKIDVVFSTQHHEDSNGADHTYEMNQGRSTRIF